MAEGNSYSFLHITKPEIDLDPSISLYDDQVYAKGRFEPQPLDRQRLSRPGFHALPLRVPTKNGRARTNRPRDRLRRGRLRRKPHQKAMKKRAKSKRTTAPATYMKRAAMRGPVFLTIPFPRRPEPPDRHYHRETGRHRFRQRRRYRTRFWKVADAEWIEQVQSAMQNVPCAYVADGHHRAKSGSRVRELRKNANPNHNGTEAYNFFMAVLFPHDQLQILPYNRAVKRSQRIDSRSGA